MKKQRPGDAQIVIRLYPEDKEALQEEADAEMLSLSAYIRRLFLMNPNRPKKVKK